MKRLISIRELITRINRKLAKDSKQLIKYKPRIVSDHPIDEYAIIDVRTNSIVNFHMSEELQEFARTLGCLTSLEEVAAY